MRGFGDFKRVAVILLPDDEEFKQRIDKKNEAEDSKGPSENAINEMKGNIDNLVKHKQKIHKGLKL